MIGSFLRQVARAAGYSLRAEYPALLASPQSRLGLEPAWLLAALAARPNPVTFIQVGANDGERADPIRAHILDRHWRGLLFEPDIHHFEKLRENYRGETQLRLINAAVGNGAEMDLYYFDPAAPNAPDWVAGLGSFDRRTVLSHCREVPSLEPYLRQRKVSTVTVDRMFQMLGEPTVDLLLTDVEGYDADIIQQIDFRRWMPGCIFYESKHLSRSRHDELLGYLIASGYLVAPGGSDSVAIRPNLF